MIKVKFFYTDYHSFDEIDFFSEEELDEYLLDFDDIIEDWMYM